jgi:hypothetical protein
MRQRIHLPHRDEYRRIVARVPADLEHACRRLASSEGWGLGDLWRSLIVLGACASYLTLGPSEPRKPASNIRFSSVLKEYLGGRAYAPRAGRRSKVMTVRLPAGVARILLLYSKLTSRLRSHTCARFLHAGLLIYLASEKRLAGNLETTRTVRAHANHHRR